MFGGLFPFGLSQAGRKLSTWARSHLKHDLRPYVCTYNECTEQIVLYDSWEDWTRHEQWAHQQRIWRCSEHPQDEYVELGAYKDHVRTYHTASVHQLLSSELLKSPETVSQVCDRPCPFCRRQFERPVDLQQHIAGHLEMIAMLSLPILDNINDNSEAGNTNSNSANHDCADSKAGDFDHTEPVAFSENDPLGSTALVTEIAKELFKTELTAESISFASMNQVNVETRQAYSGELVRGWFSNLPCELKQDGGSRSSDQEEQSKPCISVLSTLGESAQDISAILNNFLDPLDDQSAEIRALIAECLSISSVLRDLDRKIGDKIPYHRRYPLISRDLTTVKDSLNYTFDDVKRLFRGSSRISLISRVEYNHIWQDLSSFFRKQSGNSLRRRLEIYCYVLKQLSYTLIEG